MCFPGCHWRCLNLSSPGSSRLLPASWWRRASVSALNGTPAQSANSSRFMCALRAGLQSEQDTSPISGFIVEHIHTFWSLCGSFGVSTDKLQMRRNYFLFQLQGSSDFVFLTLNVNLLFCFWVSRRRLNSHIFLIWKPVCWMWRWALGSIRAQTEGCEIFVLFVGSLCSHFLLSVSFRRLRRPAFSSQPCCVAGLCGRGESSF